MTTGSITTSNYNSNDDYLLYKILILGDIGCGKTSIHNRYINNEFNNSKSEFGVKNIIIDNKNCKFQIWDPIIMDDKFRCMTKSFYRNAIGIMLVYDVTNHNSFNNLTYWLNEIKVNSTYPLDNISIIVVSNKNDLDLKESNKLVDPKQVQQFCDNHSIHFINNLSAKDSINIDESFLSLFNLILKNTNYAPLNTSYNNNNNNDSNKYCNIL